jgi:hypothetical protein
VVAIAFFGEYHEQLGCLNVRRNAEQWWYQDIWRVHYRCLAFFLRFHDAYRTTLAWLTCERIAGFERAALFIPLIDRFPARMVWRHGAGWIRR